MSRDVIGGRERPVCPKCGYVLFRNPVPGVGVLVELEGGVVLNAGSAVVMPEVFLKALTIARNLGHRIEDFAAVNFDMIRHYRALANVVSRPTRAKGWGAHFTGQHEILLPLLCAALMDRLGPFRAPGAR